MIELNPDDAFDSVIIDMVQMNRKKRSDYAADSDIFSNFRNVADSLGLEGFTAIESAYALLLTKVARLKSLRLNGRMDDPANESVMDTYLDLAVYATIILALVKEKAKNANSSPTEKTSRPRPDNVRSGRSTTSSQREKEKFLGDLYTRGAIDNKTFNSLMAAVRGRATNGAPAEHNDDKDVSAMQSEFFD